MSILLFKRNESQRYMLHNKNWSLRNSKKRSFHKLQWQLILVRCFFVSPISKIKRTADNSCERQSKALAKHQTLNLGLNIASVFLLVWQYNVDHWNPFEMHIAELLLLSFYFMLTKIVILCIKKSHQYCKCIASSN